MRLSIRPEQMLVIETVAQENFVRRIAAHLRSEYPQATVTLPTNEEFTVIALAEERLRDLVRTGIARARGYEMTLESSIAAFTAIMFEIAPNFDEHRLCQVLLNDEQLMPDARLDELLNVLTEKNWESIRADYDPQAWTLPEETAKSSETEAPPNQTNEPQDLDMQETIRI
jgi:hypothetical protein